MPFQIFPGIFSSIDAYTKRVVHAWIDRNGYAAIAEHLDYGNISKLALVYAEPVTNEDTAAQAEIHTNNGFTMPFSVFIHPVERDLGMLEPLYKRAREIYDLPGVSEGREDCDDCKRLDNLMLLARKYQETLG